MTGESIPSAVASGVTLDLNLWSGGDREALNRAFTVLYDELQVLARARLRSFPKYQTAEAGSLLHDAYLRLGNTGKAGFASRSDFFLLASRIMRNILVDMVRKRQAIKSGKRVEMTLSAFGTDCLSVDVIALDDALKRLEKVDPERAKIVEMAFFGEMTADDIAAELKISKSTVMRRLRTAQAWLASCLKSPEAPTGHVSARPA